MKHSSKLLLSSICVGFVVSGVGCAKVESNYAEPMLFNKPTFPSYVADVRGFHNVENWGRWTADGPATIEFKNALPAKFAVSVLVDVYGPNSSAPVKVKAGNVVKEVVMPGSGKVYRVEFQTAEPTKTIEFIAPKPIAPKDHAPPSTDDRKLGIGIKELRIEKL
jgi:hypothetical protein